MMSRLKLEEIEIKYMPSKVRLKLFLKKYKIRIPELNFELLIFFTGPPNRALFLIH